MKKLILDPGLFEISGNLSREDQIEHFTILRQSITFAATFLDVGIDTYNGAPYFYFYDPSSQYQDPPITKSRIVKTRFAELRKDIQRMMRNGRNVTISDKIATCDSMSFDLDSITTSPFLAYIYFLISNSQQSGCLLLLSPQNAFCAPIVGFQAEDIASDIMAISDPEIDCNGIVVNFLKPSANSDEMFPQKLACTRLNQAFLNVISSSQLSVPEKRGLYQKFGNEVASRNYYRKHPEISRKNPQYKVYVHAKSKYYLSVDCEHGGLEIFSCGSQHPAHLGEYDFSCNYQKSAEPTTHNLTI